MERCLWEGQGGRGKTRVKNSLDMIWGIVATAISEVFNCLSEGIDDMGRGQIARGQIDEFTSRR